MARTVVREGGESPPTRSLFKTEKKHHRFRGKQQPLTTDRYYKRCSALAHENSLSNSSYTLQQKEQKGKQNTYYVLASC